jgi:glyoxylate reductase
MFSVFVTRKISEAGLSLLRARKDVKLVVYGKNQTIPRAELLKKINGCDAVLTLLNNLVDAKFFSSAGKQLKVVANYAVGYDNVDLAEAERRGVVVTNTPMVLNDAVAEHTIALIMAVSKRIVEADGFLRSGKYKGWAPELFLGTELTGKVLGIIGTGNIGSGVARRAKHGLGMQVVYSDVKKNEQLEKETGATFMSTDEVLKTADIISLHVPLLDSTRHLINAKRITMMKKGAYLINTSRGPVIDEKALVKALKAGRIAGAGLDVFEFEPKLSAGLAKLKNIVITPHTASATTEARDRMAVLAVKALLSVLDGKRPENVVSMK